MPGMGCSKNKKPMAGKRRSVDKRVGGSIRVNRAGWGGEEVHTRPHPTENSYSNYGRTPATNKKNKGNSVKKWAKDLEPALHRKGNGQLAYEKAFFFIRHQGNAH